MEFTAIDRLNCKDKLRHLDDAIRMNDAEKISAAVTDMKEAIARATPVVAKDFQALLDGRVK